ncbi:MAG: TadE/TadG family type IV pilus assembly protein [Desulfobaccales bacterium]
MNTIGNRRLIHFSRSSRGVAVVEFAIILPILVTFLVGMVEFGHVWFLQHALTNASREGARVGVVYRKDNNGNDSWGYQQTEDGLPLVKYTVKNFLNAPDGKGTFFEYHDVDVAFRVIDVPPPGINSGDNLEVRVTARKNVTLLLDALIKWFNPSFQGITVEAITTMRLE